MLLDEAEHGVERRYEGDHERFLSAPISHATIGAPAGYMGIARAV